MECVEIGVLYEYVSPQCGAGVVDTSVFQGDCVGVRVGHHVASDCGGDWSVAVAGFGLRWDFLMMLLFAKCFVN